MHRDVVVDYILNKLKALLILGGAVVLVCCGSADNSSKSGQGVESKDYLMTESSRNLTIRMSENGRPSYIFEATVVEGYNMANEPYRIFPEGVKIRTFSNDSLNRESGQLTANYAIYYEDRQLWEAIGDVYATNIDGKILTSQQLFWNAQTQRIYSNVDTRIEDRATGDIYDGEGFESDEAMTDWSFRKLKGRMRVDEPVRKTTVVEVADSVDIAEVVDGAENIEGLEVADSLKVAVDDAIAAPDVLADSLDISSEGEGLI